MKQFQLKVVNETLYNAVIEHGKSLGYTYFPKYCKDFIYIQFWDDSRQTHSDHIHNARRFPLITLEEYFEMGSQQVVSINLSVTEEELEAFIKECKICTAEDFNDAGVTNVYKQILKELTDE